MASSSSSLPPSHPSSSSSVSCEDAVFLSFREEDTRKGFVGHLYEALVQRGFYTFKDDDRLRRGETISDQLLKAIEESRYAIVVFSKDYASSSWCLDELEKIMDCKEKLGLAVLPVFYDVAPSDVRGQRGTFGEGFTKAAERNADKSDKWRKALSDAAGLSGYDVTANGFESQCIKNVLEWCSSHSCNISAIDEDLIGMRSRVRKLMSLLGRDPDDVKRIGIWGMGGAGKTTVAEATFREVKKQFHDGASFIADVREKSKRIDGLQDLQKKILRDILMDKTLEIDRVSDGKEMIKRRLGRKKVLIILDDVDDEEQLCALAGDPNWFGAGSRVVITTRDRHLLEAHGVDQNDIYSANLLSEDEAILLFNRHAFKNKCGPTKEYKELSLCVIGYAAGLPLALKVLGSFLCGRGMTEWTSALKRVEKIPEEKIIEKLKISYDGLKEVEKQIFLDIACLFYWWEKDEVIRIHGSDAVIGIDVLVQKSLISLSSDQKRFQMHDLLKEMGRDIGGRSRLWHYKDIERVLQINNTTETEAIEAIVDIGLLMSKFLKTWFSYLEHTFDVKVFENMKKLRILHLHTNHKWVNKLEYLSDELRWLSWEDYPYESLPESFQASKLVKLEMGGSKIVQLWEGTKLLYNLKFLDLSSSNLVRTPDFSCIPNLETLVLYRCSKLIALHPSIGDLQRLVSLDLSHCPIGTSADSLDLSLCPIGTSVKPLSGLSRLKELYLDECGLSEEDIPVDIGKLSSLEELYLRGNPFTKLPSSISHLSRLKILDLHGCYLLKALPELPSSIAILDAYRCKSLECVEGLPEKCEWLWYLSLVGCWSLTSCDHNCHCNNKEKQSSISSGRSKSAEASKAARVYCRKHSKLTDVVKSMLLQGRALVNHQLSIAYCAGIMDPWMWFDGQQQVKKGNRCVLKLPPNWQKKTTGFAMCAAFDNRIGLPYIEISFSKEVNNQSVNIPLSTSEEEEDDWTSEITNWIGYISFKMLRRSYEGVIPAESINNATHLSVSLLDVEFYGVRLVDNREDIQVDSESATAFCPSISSGLQPRRDPNFAASTKLHCYKKHETGDDTLVISLPEEF